MRCKYSFSKANMFKYISLLLIVAIVASCCSLIACTGLTDDEGNGNQNSTYDEFYSSSDGCYRDYSGSGAQVDVAVIGSPRVMAEADIQDVNSECFEHYKYMENTKTALEFSEALFKTSIDFVIESPATCAIIIGDLTDNCSYSSMQVVAAGCAKLAAAGISVFVTGGIRDVPLRS